MNRKKKILFIESGQGYGGSSKYMVDLFRSLDRGKYEPLLAYYQPGLNFDLIRDAGFKVFNLDVKLLPATNGKGNHYAALGSYLLASVLPAVPKIISIIKREQIDLLHLNNELLTHLPGMMAAKLTGKKTICHFQGYRKLTRLEKMVGGWPDAYFALSHAGADLFSRELGREVTAIHHAVDLNQYDPGKYRDKKDLRAQFPGTKLVGLVGRLVSWKGQDIFIESARTILKKHRNVKFLMIGDDPDAGKPFRQKLEKKVADYGIQDNVIFLGWRNDIPSVVSQLDIFVHASTLPEAFGIVIIEAMAMKKPVIATKAGGVPELIEDQVSGFLIPPSDAAAMSSAIEKLLQDEKLAVSMGEVGRRRVEEFFDIRLNAARVQEAYEKLLGHSV